MMTLVFICVLFLLGCLEKHSLNVWPMSKTKLKRYRPIDLRYFLRFFISLWIVVSWLHTSLVFLYLWTWHLAVTKQKCSSPASIDRNCRWRYSQSLLWTIWKFLMEACVTLPLKLSTWEAVSSFHTGVLLWSSIRFSILLFWCLINKPSHSCIELAKHKSEKKNTKTNMIL